MSRGLNQATAREAAELLSIIELADYDILRIIEVWVNLSDAYEDRAARPEIFIDYLRDRLSRIV